jgi:hypothetical protein
MTPPDEERWSFAVLLVQHANEWEWRLRLISGPPDSEVLGTIGTGIETTREDAMRVAYSKAVAFKATCGYPGFDLTREVHRIEV